VKTLVELGADKEAKSVNGSTPLHRAAYNGHVEAATALVALGADVQAKAADGATPLHEAAYSGHVEATKALVALGADKEATTAICETPLHLAALYEHVETVKVLVALGADMQAKTTNGETPLQLCRKLGPVEKLPRPLPAPGGRSRAVTRECTEEAIAHAERMGAALIEEEEARRRRRRGQGERGGCRAMRRAEVLVRLEWLIVGRVVGITGRATAAAEAQRQGQGWSGWRAVQPNDDGGQRWRGEHVTRRRLSQHAVVRERSRLQHGAGSDTAFHLHGRRSRSAWCAWSRPRTTSCCRACTCARARRARSIC